MKKFTNFICMMVALLATLVVVSCGKAKKEGVNLYNYVVKDYQAVAKINVDKVMGDDGISEHVKKIIEESDASKLDNLEGIKEIIIVVKDKEFPYGLIKLTVPKDEFLKNIEKSCNVKKIKVADKQAYVIAKKEAAEKETNYFYFINDKNLIASGKKGVLEEIVKEFTASPVMDNFKNNVNLQKDIKGLEKFPIWFSFRDEEAAARGTFSLPSDDNAKYVVDAEVMPSAEDYDEAKKQLPGMKDMMIGMFSIAIQDPELPKKINNDLKIEFDDKTKMIKVKFAFNPKDYKGYTDKMIELSKQKEKGIPPTVTK